MTYIPRVFFTSDLHFGHRRMVGPNGTRPFSTTEEHDETIIANWNTTVTDDRDLTWIVGDYSMGDRARALGYLSRMRGRKILVEGNHDKSWSGTLDGWKHQRAYLDAGFEAVVPFSRAKLPPTRRDLPGRKVLVSHFPYQLDHTDDPRHQQFRLRDEGEWLIHGHVHHAYTVAQRGVNVGVDVWGFAPVAAEALAALIDDVEAGRRQEDL